LAICVNGFPSTPWTKLSVYLEVRLLGSLLSVPGTHVYRALVRAVYGVYAPADAVARFEDEHTVALLREAARAA
jgi:hypothetical protein